MSFLFQIVFPSDHLLRRYTITMFMALDGINEDLVIPPLSCGELSHGPVKPEQLVEQQALHGAYLFEQDGLQPCPDLLSPVEPHRLVIDEHDPADSIFGRIGQHPEWLQDDETPGRLNDRTASVFAFSTAENLMLPRRAGAPPQIELSFFAPEGYRERTDGYELFAGNAVYFFAYPEVEARVAAVVQGT